MASNDQLKNNRDIKTTIIKKWIDSVIIGQNICPFAKDQVKNNKLHIFHFDGSDHSAGLDFCIDKLIDFANKEEESFILTFSNFRDNFIQFYNFSALVEEEVRSLGLNERIQVVTFHPFFRFEGEKASARGNYVNRSPYPLLHFLDFKEVRAILEKHGDQIGEEVSFNNNRKLLSFSDQDFQTKISSFIDGHWNKQEK